MSESSKDYLELDFPWPEGPSILELIAQEGAGIVEIELPDHADSEEGGWAPGARDAVRTAGGGFDDETLRAKQVVKALRDLLSTQGQKDLEHLHRLVTRGPVLGIMDQVLGDIVHGDWIDPRALHDLAAFLARHSTQRELVKLAIGILGILSGSDDLDLLMTLGRHEEFTLYVAVAIQSTREDAETHLFVLARSVIGWGRIHVVERLAETENPEVHAWMLREGYRSDIMDVYLALLVARVAKLSDALREPVLDEALLEGSAEILFALCEGSADEDIDDYQDAAEACLRYVEGLAVHPEWWSTTHLRALNRIASLLNEGAELEAEGAPVGIEVDAEYLWAQRLENSGWTPAIRDRIAYLCSEVIEDPRWPELVAEGLASPERETYLRALSGADALGIDTQVSDLARLRTDPSWLGGWHRLAELRSDIPALIELFRELAADASLGRGPALRYDFAEDTGLEDALAVVLEASAGTPERPWDLLELGLASEWVRVRATAINAFDAWLDSEQLGRRRDEARSVLEVCAEREPSEELAQMLRASAAAL